MKFQSLFFVFILFTCSSLQAQNYQSEMDSLLMLKKSLNSERDYLNASNDSLAVEIKAIDKEIEICNTETAGLRKKLFIRKYGKVNGQRVIEGRIWKGMTEEMLKDIWGKPDKTNTDKHPWGIFTQWYYGDITYFFKNSILIDWEQKSKN